MRYHAPSSVAEAVKLAAGTTGITRFLSGGTDVLVQLQRAAHAVSDELTLKFFSHAASRSVLSLVA